MNTLTPFGKLLRILRLDHTETLKDMTEHIASTTSYSISPAFLSAVELGRKAISSELVQAVIKAYHLTTEAQQRMHAAVEESATAFKLKPSPEKRTLVAQFARRFETLNQEDMDSILKVLASSTQGDKKHEPT